MIEVQALSFMFGLLVGAFVGGVFYGASVLVFAGRKRGWW